LAVAKPGVERKTRAESNRGDSDGKQHLPARAAHMPCLPKRPIRHLAALQARPIA
jgi:hypothetical protein